MKFFAQNADADLEAVIPVFHEWIREHTVEGVLVDVADYSHVPGGPGVCLIGHEGDYYLDASEGPLGLLYNSKRPANPESDAAVLRNAFRLALKACQLLQDDKSLKGALSFDVTKARVVINDRLQAPNTPETLDKYKADLESVGKEVFGGDVSLTAAADDPRDRFSVDIAGGDGNDLSALLSRVSA